MIAEDDLHTGEAVAAVPGFESSSLRRSLVAALVLLSVLGAPEGARGHDRGQSTSDVAIFGREVSHHLDLDPNDAAEALGGFDRDGNGALDGDEVASQRAAIFEAVSSSIRIDADGRGCIPRLERMVVDEEGARLQVRSVYTCPAAPTELVLSVGLLRRMPGWHRHFAKIDRTDGEIQQAVLTGNDYVVEVPALPPGASSTAFDFLVTGIEHILIGYDHIFFLIGLIVLTRRLRQVLALVTAFTVGHSLTLVLATVLETPEAAAVAVEVTIAVAAGVIVFEYGPRWRLPWRLAAAAGLGVVIVLAFVAAGHLARPTSRVEMLIAISVVFVGVENFFFDPRRRRWLLVAAFGAVHGFGFASVLSQLHLPSARRVLSLLSFNAGVEVGQVMIAAAVFPIVVWLAREPTRDRWMVRVTSGVVVAGGLVFLAMHLL